MNGLFELLLKYPRHLYGEGQIAFSGRYPLELRIVLAALIALGTYWVYRRLPARVSRGRRLTLFGLRVAIMVLMMLVILPPILKTFDNRPLDRFAVFLVDDSRSMTIEDAAGGRSRLAAVKNLLMGEQDPRDLMTGRGLLSEATSLGGVRVFRFAGGVDRVATPAELKAEGEITDLYAAIKGVDDRLRGVPLSALVILSDGANTAQDDPLNAVQLMASKSVPIYAVGLGNANPPPDREVVMVSGPRVVRRPANVDVLVTVATHGYTTPYVVRLSDNGTVLGETKVDVSSDDDIRQVKIPLFVNKEGVFNYTVEIPPERSERVVRNNTQPFRLEVQERRLPVLYMEGSPRTEYRFIRGALFRDKDFKIVSTLRTGKDQSGREKYLVQGEDGDSALAKELLNGFPRSKELLNSFEAVILGDVEAAMLNKDQQTMLEEFVSKHGGGFLMLGGVNSFNAGGYEGTPIAGMLPVEMAGRDMPYQPSEFRVRVAEKGITHPIMRQVDDPVANASIWNGVSPLIGHNPVKRLKPAAMALLESVETGEPILAVQNYGAGRTAAFTTGGSWFWRMDREVSDRLHERFWRQLIRWLSVGAQSQLAVQTDKDTYLPREPVVLQATVLGKNLEPLNNAVVEATIETPFGAKQRVHLDWLISKEGVYQGRYIPSERGEYKVTYSVQNPKDTAIQESQARFGVREAYTEFARSWQNRPLLQALAKQTGGAYYDERSAGDLIADMKKALTPGAVANGQVTVHTLWDLPVLLGLLLTLLIAEWYLRRRTGLP